MRCWWFGGQWMSKKQNVRKSIAILDASLEARGIRHASKQVVMFGFFKKKKRKGKYDEEEAAPLEADMHSHLIFDVDDGASTLEESIELIRRFEQLGFQRLVTTPHIMSDFYRNTPEILLPKLEILQKAIANEGISVKIDVAAEYYLDEGFLKKLDGKERLLTIGDKLLLFETSYMNESRQMNEAVFRMQSNGYTPVLAHPERYTYLAEKFEVLEDLHEKGVKMQVNINSLTGYYSQAARDIAERLIDQQMVDFLGSDCHKMPHLELLEKAKKLGYYKRATQLVKNNTLVP